MNTSVFINFCQDKMRILVLWCTLTFYRFFCTVRFRSFVFFPRFLRPFDKEVFVMRQRGREVRLAAFLDECTQPQDGAQGIAAVEDQLAVGAALGLSGWVPR